MTERDRMSRNTLEQTEATRPGPRQFGLQTLNGHTEVKQKK